LWDQAWKKANSGFHAAVNWAEKHKAEIAGVAVGLAVGVGCGLAIGWTGVGAVACGALAGAVGSMVTYALATPAKERSLGGLLLAGAIGAATGVIPFAGKFATPLVGAAVRQAGAKIAQGIARAAVQRAVGAVASKVGGGLGRAAAHSEGLSSGLKQLAEAHITETGDTVLGRYPGYIAKAQARDASYFDIGDAWNSLSPAERTGANNHFLDVIADRGDRVLLSTVKREIGNRGALPDEIKYLTRQRGYSWVNQWSLRPSG
jgi:hypothetical protein